MERAPIFPAYAFDCPYCGVNARQDWYEACGSRINPSSIELPFTSLLKRFNAAVGTNKPTFPSHEAAEQLRLEHHRNGSGSRIANLHVSECHHCGLLAVWRAEKLIWPKLAPRNPHADLPAECLADFREACAIADVSPRAAAALLRASMEKLLSSLSGEDNPNEAIKKLVREGLPSQFQQAMDVVRVTGNKALHGYAIDIDADQPASFDLLATLHDRIVDLLITQRLLVEEAFGSLPPAERAKIGKRDGN